jgi:hypothetical protein
MEWRQMLLLRQRKYKNLKLKDNNPRRMIFADVTG